MKTKILDVPYKGEVCVVSKCGAFGYVYIKSKGSRRVVRLGKGGAVQIMGVVLVVGGVYRFSSLVGYYWSGKELCALGVFLKQLSKRGKK